MSIRYKIVESGQEKFYELLAKASTAFPYSNDLMHVGLLGTLPYLLGRHTASKLNFSERASNLIGAGAACVSEILWRGTIEPNSPFDHPEDSFSDYKGTLESLLGALIGITAVQIRKAVKKTN